MTCERGLWKKGRCDCLDMGFRGDTDWYNDKKFSAVFFLSLIQVSRVSRFRFLGNAWWDRRSRKVSTNSRISAITEYSFQLCGCLPLIYAVFFHWNTSFTPFILFSNSINCMVSQSTFWLVMSFEKKNAIKLYEFREGCLLVKCFKSVIIPFWFLL